MAPSPRTAFIISASSDIGAALAGHWATRGWQVAGTYRTPSPAVDALAARGIHLQECDLEEPASIARATSGLRAAGQAWDVLVLAAGSLDPVGPFASGDFDAWERSIRINFTAQLRLVRELLPVRRCGGQPSPCVLFFAGGGTNSATVNQSAYTVSKIALIKMCELLAAEISDSRFAIVGPGFVQTKIHEATLRAPEGAGDNHRKTVEILAEAGGGSGGRATPMSQVLGCCDWLVDAPREVMNGRNFSVAFDRWGSRDLEERLVATPDMYKLRRAGNGGPGGHR